MTCTRNWGEVLPPGFAYDLFKAEMWKRARSQGLRRYGKATSGDDDTRPIGLDYRTVWGIGSWSPRNGSPALIDVSGNIYDATTSYSQPDAKPNTPTSYRSDFDVPTNTGHSLRAYLNEPPHTQLPKLHQWQWGQPGAGVVFQIRNGTPEIGLKSVEFNLGDLAALNVLWAVENPSLAQSQQIEDLLVKLFDTFESLSFEKSTSKTDWYNNLWAVTFIPEERGVLHVVLEGGDATSIEYKSILETGKPGTLWETSKIDLFCGGGAFFFQSGYPLFVGKGQLLFGPYREGNYYADSLGDLFYRVNGYPSASLNFQKVAWDADGIEGGGGSLIDFGFQLTITGGGRKTPFVYGASARFENGPRNGGTTVVWDSDDLYEPANPETPRYTGETVLDMVPSFDGQTNKRAVKVTFWNPRGALTVVQGVPHNMVATATIDGSPMITNGLIPEPPEESDMRSLDALALNATNWDSELSITIYDGWHILSEVDCDPTVIADDLFLADAIRRVLRIVGYTNAEMAGVVPGTGKRLPKAPLGEDYCCRPDKDTTCADVLRGLMESYGLYWRFYQNRFGVWQLKRIDTTNKGVFVSTGVGLSNLTPTGRLAILKPIDLIHNKVDFNHFVAAGGKNGDLIRQIHNWPSIRRASSPFFIGRRKTKKLRNSGLATRDDVQYALRSMEWMYGRGGRRGQYTSFFSAFLEPGDRITVDGANWEIEGLSGGSWARDEAQFNVLEVI